MKKRTVETETDLRDFLELNHFETLTYDKLIHIKKQINENPDSRIPQESIEKIDRLLNEKEHEIKSFSELEKLGYALYEEGNMIHLRRSKSSKRTDVQAIILGSMLSVFGFAALVTIFGYIFNTMKEEFTFATFVSLSFLLLIGGTGVLLLSKGIMRRNKYQNFIINVEGKKIVWLLNGTSEMFSKDDYKFEYEFEKDKHKIVLFPLNEYVDKRELFEFEFSNFSYHKTLQYLTAKLNS